MVLVDTSVWSVAFRHRHSALNTEEERARRDLITLIEGNQVQLLGAVRQELLSGLRERAQYERLRELLRSFRDVKLEIEDYEGAAAMSNLCRSKGIAGNSIDFLICAAAVRRRWTVLTLDRDFMRYATCLPIKVHSASA